VGEVTRDTHVPAGQALRERRLDETVAGAGTTATLVDGRRPKVHDDEEDGEATARRLGLEPEAPGLVSWDVFEAVLAPGELMLLLSWKDAAAAEAHERTRALGDGDDRRLRRVRVLRDYGMFDRREAPQYFPEVRDGRPPMPA